MFGVCSGVRICGLRSLELSGRLLVRGSRCGSPCLGRTGRTGLSVNMCLENSGVCKRTASLISSLCSSLSRSSASRSSASRLCCSARSARSRSSRCAWSCCCEGPAFGGWLKGVEAKALELPAPPPGRPRPDAPNGLWGKPEPGCWDVAMLGGVGAGRGGGGEVVPVGWPARVSAWRMLGNGDIALWCLMF